MTIIITFHNYVFYLRLITDRVDSLVSPEVVFPTSLKDSDYTIGNKVVREMCIFYHVPFPFLFREGWSPGSVNLYETYDSTIKHSVSAKEFKTSTRTQKNAMYARLVQCIESNEMVDEELPDAAIIQAAFLQSR